MPQRDSQFGLMLRLVWRDYRHEWLMSGCFVLALTAVLVPLLVLFGLKFGIISNLLDPLVEDPRYRQIQPAGSGKFGPDWFEAMRTRPDVAFVVPRTRAIAATIKLRKPDSEIGRILDVELIPSAINDPALTGDITVPTGFENVVLSVDAADKLGAVSGTRLEGILNRSLNGEQQSVRMPMEVVGIAPAQAFSRDGLFVSTELLVAVEDFRDGQAVPVLGWNGVPPRNQARHFAGFRLYARSISDVATLRSDLLNQGIDVRTRVADIELVNTLERNLSIVFWIIAIIAATGFGLSFGSSVWANVDRKQKEFSVLRLTGFRTSSIVWFPMLQAMLTAALGWAVACGVFFVVQIALNAMFVANFGEGQAVCKLLPWHMLVALLATLLAASAAAALGGVRAAKLEPSLGLREE